MKSGKSLNILESLYKRYNKKEFIHPDPLEFLHVYPSIRDREIVGILAAALAYGRVKQITGCVSAVLDTMRQEPYTYLINMREQTIKSDFRNFKYRFTTSEHLVRFFMGIKSILHQYGSLENCFMKSYKASDSTVIPGLSTFVKIIMDQAAGDMGILMPDPDKKSACKRNFLFLRWMIRCDDVDPGGWKKIPASKLLIPLDTHMHKIALLLGFTKRKQANLKTTVEITNHFKVINPDDPVKYDFTLTRFGIRDDMAVNQLKQFVNKIQL